MPKAIDILNYIDSFAPYSTACEWDNTGFSEGNINSEVKKIVFALDITSKVIDFAESENADLIVTHHPLIFRPVKSVRSDSILYKAVKSGIAHISVHTNFDIAKCGVNDALCAKLNLKIVDSVKTYDGAVIYKCTVKNECSLAEFANYVKEKLGGAVRYSDIDKKISVVAVCSGAGADYLTEAKNIMADALLTGDGGHHSFLDANEIGIALVCAGHFETENPSVDILMKKIGEKFSVECIKAPQTSPIKTV